jgi:hypothetical protein
MGRIINAANNSIALVNGDIPDVSGALKSYFQLMQFGVITKQTIAFQVVETVVDYSFWGVLFPLNEQRLNMETQGQRTQWQWFKLFAEPAIDLQPDYIVIYLGVQYRVMDRKDYLIYGYREFTLQTDWINVSP